MTTTVIVKAYPHGQLEVVVEAIDAQQAVETVIGRQQDQAVDAGTRRSELARLQNGESGEYHATDSRQIVVSERPKT